MFTRAGFRPNHSVVCHARVRLHPYATVYTAKLIRFHPSGDLAWYSRARGFLVWGERVRVVSVLDFFHEDLDIDLVYRASNIEAFHRKFAAAKEAGCLAVAT